MRKILFITGAVIVALLLVFLSYKVLTTKERVVTKYSVHEVPVMSFEKEEALRQALEKQDSLSFALVKATDRLKSYTSVNTKFRVDTLRIPLTDTVYQVRVKEKIVERIVLRNFGYTDQTLSFNGKVGPTELTIDSLIVKSRIALIQVDRKPKGIFNKIFKKRKATVIAVSEDPRISLTGVTTLEVKPPSDNYWKGFRDGAITGGAVGVGLPLIIK